MPRLEPTRREFTLATTSALLAGLAPAGCQSPHEKPEVPAGPLEIIDTHQHLWDREILDLPWLGDRTDGLGKSHTTKDYLEATHGLNLQRAVYMEVDVRADQKELEARHVLELCRDPAHPTVAAVIGGRPGEPGFEEYARKFRDEPLVRGYRRVLHGGTPRGHCLTDAFVQSMELLGRQDKTFDLCLRASELDDGATLARRCPDTLFILDHCGNANPTAFTSAERRQGKKPSHDPDAWRASIDELASCSNIVCKISGIIARAPRDWQDGDLAPIIDHCLDAFGPDRVFFGSDWPVCTRGAPLRDWVHALERIVAHRSLEDRRKLWSENAERIYRLG